MKAIRAVALLTIRDGIRGRAWFPFVFALILCFAALLFGLGWRNLVAGRLPTDTRYLYNIVSLVFYLWAWGSLWTALFVGSTSIPRERKTPTLFTLPIARWEMALGKLIGAEILIAGFLVAGYALCAGLARWCQVPIRAYSGLGLATALTTSFVYLCLSVPLGGWLSPVVVGTLTLFAEGQASVFDALKTIHLGTGAPTLRVVLACVFPWQIPPEPLRRAFGLEVPVSFDDISILFLNAFIGALFFIGLTFLMKRRELRLR